MGSSTPPCLIQRFQRPPNMRRLSVSRPCHGQETNHGNKGLTQTFWLKLTNRTKPIEKRFVSGASRLARTEFVLSFLGDKKFFTNVSFPVGNKSFGGKSLVFLQFVSWRNLSTVQVAIGLPSTQGKGLFWAN